MDAVPLRMPKVTSLSVIDERHVSVLFSKAIRAKAPALTLGSGVELDKWALSGDERELKFSMKTNLPPNDKLTISGFTDQNQQPNAIEIKGIGITVPAWPVDRTAMVYRWDNGLKPNL